MSALHSLKFSIKRYSAISHVWAEKSLWIFLSLSSPHHPRSHLWSLILLTISTGALFHFPFFFFRLFISQSASLIYCLLCYFHHRFIFRVRNFFVSFRSLSSSSFSTRCCQIHATESICLARANKLLYILFLCALVDGCCFWCGCVARAVLDWTLPTFDKRIAFVKKYVHWNQYFSAWFFFLFPVFLRDFHFPFRRKQIHSSRTHTCQDLCLRIKAYMINIVGGWGEREISFALTSLMNEFRNTGCASSLFCLSRCRFFSRERAPRQPKISQKSEKTTAKQIATHL